MAVCEMNQVTMYSAPNEFADFENQEQNTPYSASIDFANFSWEDFAKLNNIKVESLDETQSQQSLNSSAEEVQDQVSKFFAIFTVFSY